MNPIILTDIEKRILILLKAGHGFKTVGAELKLSPRHVKYTVDMLRRRHRYQNTTQLIAAVVEQQVI